MAPENTARTLRIRPLSTEPGTVVQQPAPMKPRIPPVAPPMEAEAQPAPGGAKSAKPSYPCIEITPRSVWIGSRRTSIRLEPEFWTALGEISREQRSTISGVLLDIERIHGRSRFASKVRVAILAYYRR